MSIHTIVMQKETQKNKIISFIKSYGYYARMKDFKSAGFRTSTIKEFVEQGILEKIKPGLYRLSEIDEPSEISLDLLDISKAIPEGRICLLSALSHFQLTTFNPSRVDVAIKSYSRAPKTIHPPVNIYFFTKRYFETGTMQIETKYGKVNIYDQEKTICDVFRYRKKLGEDIALESLKNYLNGTKINLSKLHHYAEVCNVKTIITPYIKSLVE